MSATSVSGYERASLALTLAGVLAGCSSGGSGDDPYVVGASGTGGDIEAGEATGGNSAGGGAAVTGRGGSQPGSGGTNDSTGGAQASTGGTTSTTDPNAAAQISACIDSLPWGQNNIEDRDALISVIIRTCQEFAPPGAEWQTYCQLFLATAINKESSYNAALVVEDSYGGATDPTVGLTQIRFSSTVSDFDDQGPIDAIERIGCSWPTINEGDTALEHMDMMQDIACNIGLGAWYYFVYATGNGGSQVVYLYQYCQGQGVAANLYIGMLSHLRGPAGAVGSSYDDPYITEIKGWFDTCLDVNGIQVRGEHPFGLTLQPEPSKYCR